MTHIHVRIRWSVIVTFATFAHQSTGVRPLGGSKDLNLNDAPVLITGLSGKLGPVQLANIETLMDLCYKGVPLKCNLLLMLRGDVGPLLSRNATIGNLYLVNEPEKLEDMPRTCRIAHLRNHMLQQVEGSTLVEEHPYIAVADFDGVLQFSEQVLGQMRTALQEVEVPWGGLSFNSGTYYDWFALRCSAESRNCYEGNGNWAGCHDASNFPCSQQLQSMAATDTLEVASAFNALAVYKTSSIGDCRYSGKDPDGGEECEHVTFHECLRGKGERVIISGLKVENDYGAALLYPHWVAVHPLFFVFSRCWESRLWICAAAILGVCFLVGFIAKRGLTKNLSLHIEKS